MGKMKELFMKIHFPYGEYDVEREYLIDDSLARDQEYLEYLELQSSLEMNTINSKIEVKDGQRETRIQVNQEGNKSSGDTKIQESGFQSFIHT